MINILELKLRNLLKSSYQLISFTSERLVYETDYILYSFVFWLLFKKNFISLLKQFDVAWYKYRINFFSIFYLWKRNGL